MDWLISKKLGFRPIAGSDFKFIKFYLGGTKRTRYLPLGRPYSNEEAEKWLVDRLAHWQKYNFGIFVVTSENSKSIGYCGLEHIEATDYIDIRYGLVEEVWGKGLGNEAVTSMIRFGFERLGLEIIYGAAVHDNLSSIRILEQVGMRSDRKFDYYGNVVAPYSLRRDEYLTSL